MDNKPQNKNLNTEDELDKILKIIKSCIASTKENLTVDQLHRDYKQLMGSPIPFKKFQHGTLASFLQSFPETIKIYNRGGQLYVQTVTSHATSHLVSLIRGQKKSQSKASFSKPNVMRRPQSHVPWRTPSYSQRGRRFLLPNPIYNHLNIKGDSRALQMPNSQPLMRSSQSQFKPKNMNENQFIQRPPPVQNSMNPPKQPVPNTKFRMEIEKIARDKGISPPKYEVVIYGKKNKYLCNLTVGDQKFHSYPDDKDKPDEAVEVACKKAVEEFSKEISKNSTLPETNDFDKAKEKVMQILKKNSGASFWWDHVRACYETDFKESIPNGWVEKARKRCKDIQIENPFPGKYTLQIKNDTQATSTANPVKISSKSKSEQPDTIKLPDDNMWNVFVSYIKDFSEICFRIIEDEYSHAFEEFVTEMELHYFGDKNLKPIMKLVIDEYYICQHEDSWFRIRLVSVEGDKASVFFIDHGDIEVVSSSKLFCLDSKFLKFPSQGITACLAGFEFEFCDQKVISKLQNLALGKTLVAEVLSREENISIVLYDTSTEEDININEQLMQMLPDAYPTPTFPTIGGICEAYVSHVASDGEIYVKIEPATYKVLESLFHTAKRRAEEILGNDSLSIDMGKLYLAKFSTDGEWHRAAPRSPNRDVDGKVLVKAIDSGMLERVFAANIVPLEIVSKMLNKIPPQCLPCRLHNVPSKPGFHWTPKASERLISMLPSRNEPLVLKVAKKGEVEHPTEVELFKRVHPENFLVSIAITLDVEMSLFRSEDNNNNCNGVGNEKSSPSFGTKAGVQKESGFSELNEVFSAFDVREIIDPSLPEIRSYFDVFVTNAASPYNFAVQSWKDAMKLEWLMKEMKTYYSNFSKVNKIEDIKQGGYYAFQHNDDSWYRVRIDKIMDDFISGTFIDYGDVFCSNSELSRKVQPLSKNFRQLPYQAFKAKLGGIVPLNKDWTPEDSFRFRELVENLPFVSIVTEISAAKDNDPPTLTLKLIDTTDPNVDKFIDEILVNENRAKKIT